MDTCRNYKQIPTTGPLPDTGDAPKNVFPDDEIDSISFHFHSTTTKTREWRDIVRIEMTKR